MKNLMIAAAVAAALSQAPGAALAASSDELAQIREQLQGLMQRVDKLEQENQTLKTENETLKAQGEELKAQGDYLKSEARGLRKDSANAQSDISKVKGADWAGKVALTGDMRYRYEFISDETSTGGVQNTADRYRDRIRARLAATAKATDNIIVGIGLTTAENNDPRSGNQSLTGVFTKKSIELDLAYFDWKFSSWGDLIGGKMKQPFVKPGASLFWDNDITPEGLALNFASGIFFGTGYAYWISENSGAENTRTSDTMLYGAQFGARLPFGASNLMLAAHYYELSAAKRRSPFYVAPGATIGASNANGNTLCGTFIPNRTTPLCEAGANPLGLAFDYHVANLSAEFNTTLGTLPLQIWGDFAKNQDPDDFDTAWMAGVLFGKASNYRTWELGVAYEVQEKDALFAQLIDSDFAGGVIDSEGWVLRAGFVPVRNWTLNATYFKNQRNRDVPSTLGGPTDIDYDRLQVDFNVKF